MRSWRSFGLTIVVAFIACGPQPAAPKTFVVPEPSEAPVVRKVLPNASWVHPENYGLARQLLAEAGFIDADLRGPEKLGRIKAKLAEIQRVTDQFVARVDEAVQKKEAEILEV